MHAPSTGEDLYRIVCDYAALGHHRSGTDRDLATAEWFAELVSDLGEVTTDAVEFECRPAEQPIGLDHDAVRQTCRPELPLVVVHMYLEL